MIPSLSFFYYHGCFLRYSYILVSCTLYAYNEVVVCLLIKKCSSPEKKPFYIEFSKTNNRVRVEEDMKLLVNVSAMNARTR